MSVKDANWLHISLSIALLEIQKTHLAEESVLMRTAHSITIYFSNRMTDKEHKPQLYPSVKQRSSIRAEKSLTLHLSTAEIFHRKMCECNEKGPKHIEYNFLLLSWS